MKVSYIAVLVLFLSAAVSAAMVCQVVPPKAGIPVGHTFEFGAICANDLGGGNYKPVPCVMSASYQWRTDVGTITQQGISPKGLATATFLAQTTPAAGNLAVDFGSFKCKARAIYVQAGAPRSCVLNPQTVALQTYGTQLFTASCADEYGNPTDCPLMEWGTDVTGGSMNPVYDNTSSVLTAGGTVQLRKRVWAMYNPEAFTPDSTFQCEAVVSVIPAPTDAVACSLSPSSANVETYATQDFSATCYNFKGIAVACPAISWATSVTRGTIVSTSPSTATLQTDNVIENNKAVIASFVSTAGSKVKCAASVNVVLSSAKTCVLQPNYAQVYIGGTQQFVSTCYNKRGNAVQCPILGWSTDVTGGVMNPTQARDSSILTAGNAPETGKHVSAAYEVDSYGQYTISHGVVFKCMATVDILKPRLPVSCELSPAAVNVTVSGTQDFASTCRAANGAVLPCPSLDWSTTVTGGSMSPTPSSSSSTLTAGNTVENDRAVTASYNGVTSFSCSAVVNVTPAQRPAVSCSLFPSDADVPLGGTQDFTPTCLDRKGFATQCPTLYWTTDVDGGHMLPTQTPGMSTLYAGTVVENNRYVKAASSVDVTTPSYFECSASVDIIPQLPQAASCSLLPSNVNVTVGGMQYFGVSCLDQYDSSVACPTMDFITDVTGGSMNPSSSNAGSTLTAGNTVENNRNVISMHFDVSGNVDFNCSASVNVTPAAQPYCALSPLTANVPQNGTQFFGISCFNADGSSRACDNMSWSTTVTNGFMNPLSSTTGSTLFAGNVIENGRSVTATSSNYACSASVDVVNYTPTSCALSPASASVGKGGTVLFTATCAGAGGSVSCPAIAWSTDVTGGWMDPLQSMSTSTLHAGTTAESGRHVVATAPNLTFSCSADVTVTDSDVVSCALTPSYSEIGHLGSQSYAVTCYRSDSSVIACPTLNWGAGMQDANMSPTQSSTSSVFFAPDYDGLGTVTASNAWLLCSAGVRVTMYPGGSGGGGGGSGGGGYYYYGPYGPAAIPGTGSFSPAPSATPKPSATVKPTATPTTRGTYHTPWTPPQLTPSATPNAGAGGLTGLFTAFAPGSWLEILIAIIALGGSAYLIRKMAAGA
ncbi:Uncharacterised protein [Candidatus Norongarragalina meridionalis]|nr:Uncharacterised protein [Candidatus Norongarragalina meridionalis]